MSRSLQLVVALILTAGVGLAAADAARRSATFSVFTEGYGEPTRSPHERFRAAEWNVPYILGLVVGVAAGVGVSVASVLWWRLARSRRPDKGTPNQAL